MMKALPSFLVLLLFFVPVLAMYGEVPEEPSPKYNWDFTQEEIVTNSPVTLGDGVTLGVPQEGVGAQEGKYCVKFNGTGLITGDKNLDMATDEFTVSTRFRCDSNEHINGLVSKRPLGSERIQFNLFINTVEDSNRIGFEMVTGNGSFIHQYTPVQHIDFTAWHDATLVYNGTHIRLFVDGEELFEFGITGPLANNDAPLIIGSHYPTAPAMHGYVSRIAMWDCALSDDEVARLHRQKRLRPLASPNEPAFPSTVRYRPPLPALAGDVMMFFDDVKERYHVFYTHVPMTGPKPYFAHLVSDDLIHWSTLPPAFLPNTDPNSPDVECWTGSVTKGPDGRYYFWYTATNWNDPRNICKVMVAVSDDLIHFQKHYETLIYPDGEIYWSLEHNELPQGWSKLTAYRDPEIAYNPVQKNWWMIFNAMDAKRHTGVMALYTSGDLLNWEIQPPIMSDYGSDCPNLFQLNERWYILTSLTYRSAKNLSDTWSNKHAKPYGAGIMCVPKGCTDNRGRRIIIGTASNFKKFQDQGAQDWGGSTTMARELWADDEGNLYQRPVKEIIDFYSQEQLGYEDDFVLSPGQEKSISTPNDYMLHFKVKLDPKATLTFRMRQQADDPRMHYLVSFGPPTLPRISSPYRQAILRNKMDYDDAVEVYAFVVDDLIECFIDGKYGLTHRAWNFREGGLVFTTEGGPVTITDLNISFSDELSAGPNHSKTQ